MLIISGISALLFFQACAGNGGTADKQAVAIDSAYALIGKYGKITYTDFTAEVEYLNDSTVHWTAIDKTGKTNEGTEKISYKQLNDHLYFLNWIEQDGLTVSQVINTKEGEVDAFLSYKDEKSTAGRSAQFLKGKFEFKK